MSKKSVQSEDKYIVRFPDGMRDRIREEAERNGRSMNAEIVTRLEISIFGGAGSEPLEKIFVNSISELILRKDIVDSDDIEVLTVMYDDFRETQLEKMQSFVNMVRFIKSGKDYTDQTSKEKKELVKRGIIAARIRKDALRLGISLDDIFTLNMAT